MDEKIELSEKDVGFWFLTRDGAPAKITSVFGTNVRHRFLGVIGGKNPPQSWSEEGQWFGYDDNPNDLVARITKDEADNLIIAQHFKDL